MLAWCCQQQSLQGRLLEQGTLLVLVMLLVMLLVLPLAMLVVPVPVQRLSGQVLLLQEPRQLQCHSPHQQQG